MTFEAQFLSMMRTSITFRHSVSMDAFGAPGSFTDYTVPAKVTYGSKVSRGDRRDNVHSTASIIIPPPGFVLTADPSPSLLPTVSMNDRFVLPDGIERRVVDVKVPFDESGTPHHQTIQLT